MFVTHPWTLPIVQVFKLTKFKKLDTFRSSGQKYPALLDFCRELVSGGATGDFLSPERNTDSF
jgi:hypothetical protein